MINGDKPPTPMADLGGFQGFHGNPLLKLILILLV